MKINFTHSNAWINAIFMRYPIDDIFHENRCVFVKKNKDYIYQHFFSIENNLQEIANFINSLPLNTNFVFKYINECEAKILFDYLSASGIEVNIIDNWEAPILNINENLHDIFLRSKHTQTIRNFKMYNKEKSKYTFKNSDRYNVFDLWTDVLNIDNYSWKKSENSDMKSLDREDLQYLPYILENKNDISILVMYKNNIPVSYSLFFRNYDDVFYAVKWGSSHYGREKYAGIICLFEHLFNIYEEYDNCIVDFWGRRSNVYDKLKNSATNRMNFEIRRK